MRLWPPDPYALSLCLAGVAGVEELAALREQMVKNQIERRGVRNAAVLAAMREIPRHLFVPQSLQRSAYEDRPLPIGYGQTISQPYIVASMSEMLNVRPGLKALEIGTGSGYQAAVLARLGARVYTIEIVEPLAKSAGNLLSQLGYKNITVRHGDGYKGWPEEAPFDRIILTAAPPELPQSLLQQLANGGRLVAPVGREWQELVVVDKDLNGKIRERTEYPVMFVPMVPSKN